MGEFIENNLDIFYWLTIVMLSIAAIVIIVFSVIQMVNNKKAATKTLSYCRRIIVSIRTFILCIVF